MSAPPASTRVGITNGRVMIWTPWRLSLVLGQLIIVAAIITVPWHGVRMPSWSTAVIAALAAGWWMPSRARKIEGDDRGLYVNGRLVAPHARITRAQMAQGTIVRVELGGFRHVTVHAANFEDAQRLLGSLALPAERLALGRLELSEPHSALRLSLAFLTMLLGAFGAVATLLFFGAAWAVAAILASGIVALALLPKRTGSAVLGHDGVRLRAGMLPDLHAARYVPYRLIRSFDDIDATSINMTLTSGERIPLRFASKSIAANAKAALSAAWAEGKKRGPLAVAPALERGEKTPSEWLRAIRGLVRSGSSYREPSMTTETLRDVVAAADAPAGVRLAAALALREVLGDEARSHLMQNARVTADAVVEGALVRIADGVDDDVAVALLEQAERAPRIPNRVH